MSTPEIKPVSFGAKMRLARDVRASGLKLGPRLLFEALIDHLICETGMCFPSIKTLASDIRVSDRTVNRWIEVLIEAGYTVQHRRRREAAFYTFPAIDQEATDASSLNPSRSDRLGNQEATLQSAHIRKNREESREEKREEDLGAHAFAAYVSMAGDLKVPKPLAATGKRLAYIEGRISDHGVDAWQQVLDEIRASGFLRGNGPRGWRIDLDWLLKSENFIKVLEGKYRDRASKGGDPDDDGEVDQFGRPVEYH
jgi:hypothetical protein